MTASDIPLTTGQTDQGGEGMRFMGYTVYDALINWDLSSFDKPSDLVPGLATELGRRSGRRDKTKWIFKIREGVKFHDGSEFTADAVVWNFDKLLKNDAPQFDQRQSAQGRSRIPAIASYKAVDKYTLEIVTKSPDASLPYQLAWIMMSSPAQWEKLGKSWDAFAKTPSGTGPWKLTLFAPRERAEMVPNKDYWDKARVPKLDKLVLLPLPEPNARVAALRAGPGRLDRGAGARRGRHRSRGAGFKIVTNAYPHNWTWHLSRAEGSPWNDIRVRKAANLAVDREGMKELLAGLMIPAEGFMPPGHQWFGKPTFKLKYDPAEAKKLLEEAGYATATSRWCVKIADLALGLGPDAAAADERVRAAEPRRGRHQGRFRGGGVEPRSSTSGAPAPSDASRKGGTGMNYTYFIQDPFTGFIRHLQCNLAPPTGTNWGHYCDPEMDKLFDAGPQHLRSEGADQGAAEGPREIRRRGAVPDGHARRQPARA